MFHHEEAQAGEHTTGSCVTIISRNGHGEVGTMWRSKHQLIYALGRVGQMAVPRGVG